MLCKIMYFVVGFIYRYYIYIGFTYRKRSVGAKKPVEYVSVMTTIRTIIVAIGIKSFN